MNPLTPIMQTSTDNPTQTFPKFRKPPLELGMMVWEEALPCPQVVEVKWSNALDGWFCPIHSGRKPCSHLSVCKELRGVYLKAWLPIFPYLPSNTHLGDDEVPQNYSRVPASPSRLPYPESPTGSVSRYEMSTHHRYAKQIEACPASSETSLPLDAKVPFSTGYFNPEIESLLVSRSGCDDSGLERTMSALNAFTNLNALQHLALDSSYICRHVGRLIQIQPVVVSSPMKFQKLKKLKIVSGNPGWMARWLWGALPTLGAVSLESYTNATRPASLSFIPVRYLPSIQASLPTACAESVPVRIVDVQEKRIRRGGVAGHDKGHLHRGGCSGRGDPKK